MHTIIEFLSESKISEEKRTLKNKPKGKSPTEWMKIKKDTRFIDEPWYNKRGTWGKSEIDGKYYGWSHRAIYGFKPGDKVGKDTLGNFKKGEWTIKTDREAAKMAAHFSDAVS